MIEIDDLVKRFGAAVAVDHVSFSVERGEVLGFLGPNGAGKSTTMKMITGFLTPTSGTARVEGFDVRVDPIEVKRRVGYLPEGAPMWSDMTPRSFLTFVAQVRGLNGAKRKDRMDAVIAQTQLESVLEKPIETLSKGFKRRVGLAQALMHDPDVLILDEPTDGLDPNQKFEVRNLISKMAPEKAIIISTHILEEVEAVCTRAIIISDGKIVADDTPENLLSRSSRHNAVSVRVVGEIAKARSVLQDMEGVATIETVRQDWLLVQSKTGASLVSEISVALREIEMPIAEIHVERGNLDDVFRTITSNR
ncbi:MAG: ABC transporter ATP-binding protein [Alphaproteobacteria bacterium]|nr:ABC transporter ATP-binding protein [Alphaproteobacteria bacterium]